MAAICGSCWRLTGYEQGEASGTGPVATLLSYHRFLLFNCSFHYTQLNQSLSKAKSNLWDPTDSFAIQLHPLTNNS
jgi:hypothetical protein